MLRLVLVGFIIIQAMMLADRSEHINHLQEYIRSNQLPVPAFPMREGKVTQEIEVEICVVNS